MMLKLYSILLLISFTLLTSGCVGIFGPHGGVVI